MAPLEPRSELAGITARLASRHPRRGRLGRAPTAATALVLHPHPSEGVRLLFVERTQRSDDPWSGQMAFPGGRRDPGDADLAATARRETWEEVGVALGAPVGDLDHVHGRTSGVVVAPFVFAVDDEPTIRRDPVEIHDTVWVPLDHLQRTETQAPFHYRGLGPFPAIRYGPYVIWGLTYRTVQRFLEAVG